jgi:AbrB family looped-hinge helix DNA binding protein
MSKKILPTKKYKTKTSSKGQIVIPKPIRDALNIDENTSFLAYIEDDQIRLIKQNDDIDAVFGALGKLMKKPAKPITQEQFEEDLEKAKYLYFKEKYAK